MSEVPWLKFLNAKEVYSWALCCKKHLQVVKPKGEDRFLLPNVKLQGNRARLFEHIAGVEVLNLSHFPLESWEKLLEQPWAKSLKGLVVADCTINNQLFEVCESLDYLTLDSCSFSQDLISLKDELYERFPKLKVFKSQQIRWGNFASHSIKSEHFESDVLPFNNKLNCLSFTISESCFPNTINLSSLDVANFPNLLHLSLDSPQQRLFDGQIDDRDCSSFVPLIKKGLVSLSLRGHVIGDPGFGTLLSSIPGSNLEKLNLSQNMITGCEVQLSGRKSWPSLREFRLDGHHEGYKLSTLRWMQKLPPNLEVFSCSEQNLTGESLSHFAGLIEAAHKDVNLFSIDFSSNLIDYNGFDAFSSMLMFCPNLARMNFSHNDISEPEIFVEMFPKCSSLRNISLAGNSFSTKDINDVLDAAVELQEKNFRSKILLDLRENLGDIPGERFFSNSGYLLVDGDFNQLTAIPPETVRISIET